VTSTNRPGTAASAGAHTTGWISSLILHGTLVFGAFTFTQQIRLAPQPTPFQWNVSMVTQERPTMPAPSHPASAHPIPRAAKAPIPSPLSQTQTVPAISPNRLEPTRDEPVEPATPMVATAPPPSPPPQREPSVMEPAPPTPTIATPPRPAEPAIQERPTSRPIDLHQQPALPEPEPVSNRGEPVPQPELQPVIPTTPVPAATPPAPVSTPTSTPAMAVSPAKPLAARSSPSQTLPPVVSPTQQIADSAPPVSEPSVAASSRRPLVTQTEPIQTPPPVAAPTPQVAAIEPVPPAAPRRRDYGWLSETISRRVEELKRYPAEARLDRAEGRVVIKAVLRADGSVDDVEIFQSSGYRTLDQAALELIQRAAPFQLPHPLGRSKMTVKIPMSYRLEP
jgi:periplasmic protein TonB